MIPKILKNKPLVEAIFEMKWKLQEPNPGVTIDPHYKILIGRLYDRLAKEYSYHEQLPTASFPDEMLGHIVQHRFRKGKDLWPLIQIGPGILTVNDTENYIWTDFEKRCTQAVESLFEAYPESKINLQIEGLLLRYINAVDFDYKRNDIFTFLREKMKTNVSLPSILFDDISVNRLPIGFDCRFSFPSSSPKGAIHLRFVRGNRKGLDALIWETMVQSVSEDVPKIPDNFKEWIDGAHTITDDWFFKLIEGELLRRFE